MKPATTRHTMSRARGLCMAVSATLQAISPPASPRSTRESPGASKRSVRQVRQASMIRGKSSRSLTAENSFWDLSLVIQSGIRRPIFARPSTNDLQAASRNAAANSCDPSSRSRNIPSTPEGGTRKRMFAASAPSGSSGQMTATPSLAAWW
jgi:hypothetical protein